MIFDAIGPFVSRGEPCALDESLGSIRRRLLVTNPIVAFKVINEVYNNPVQICHDHIKAIGSTPISWRLRNGESIQKLGGWLKQALEAKDLL